MCERAHAQQADWKPTPTLASAPLTFVPRFPYLLRRTSHLQDKQHTDDFAVPPSLPATTLDTSDWPLLLKVRAGPSSSAANVMSRHSSHTRPSPTSPMVSATYPEGARGGGGRGRPASETCAAPGRMSIPRDSTVTTYVTSHRRRISAQSQGAGAAALSDTL